MQILQLFIEIILRGSVGYFKSRNLSIYNEILRKSIDILNPTLLKQVEEYGFDVDSDVICEIIERTDLSVEDKEEILQWAKEKNLFSKDLFLSVLEDENIDLAKWLYKNGCPYDERVFSFAVEKELSFDFIKYLYKKGFPWDSDTCSAAASVGDLDLLKYLREKGCPWDGRVCSIASQNGRLDILVWAIENGCHMNEDVKYYALKNGHEDILNYLKQF